MDSLNFSPADDEILLPACYLTRSEESENDGKDPAVPRLTEAEARDRLRRALRETGQLIVTPRDDLSRVFFAGIGDPKHLLIEVRGHEDDDETSPERDEAGCVCPLPLAELLLARIYLGESTKTLVTFMATANATEALGTHPAPAHARQADYL